VSWQKSKSEGVAKRESSATAGPPTGCLYEGGNQTVNAWIISTMRPTRPSWNPIITGTVRFLQRACFSSSITGGWSEVRAVAEHGRLVVVLPTCELQSKLLRF
jgi:hypothetical protein